MRQTLARIPGLPPLRCSPSLLSVCLGSVKAPVCEGPLALERGREEREKGGERTQGGQPPQAVPTGAVRGSDTGGDGLQPRGLFPVSAHLVSEGRGALRDAGFAAPDQ